MLWGQSLASSMYAVRRAGLLEEERDGGREGGREGKGRTGEQKIGKKIGWRANIDQGDWTKEDRTIQQGDHYKGLYKCRDHM